MTTNESSPSVSAKETAHLHPPLDPLTLQSSNDEEARLACLESFGIFNHDKIALLDILAKQAAVYCGTSMAAITLLGRNTLLFKSAYGVDLKEISRVQSICASVIQSRKHYIIVSDATKDPVLKQNPYVSGDPFITFYASVPLITKRGFSIGCFAVMNAKPMDFDHEKIEFLKGLAQVIVDFLEKERQLRESERLLFLEKNVYNRLLKSTATLASMATSFDSAISELMGSLDPKLGWLSARIRNMQTGGTTGIFYNSAFPEDPELPLLWHKLDSMPCHPSREIPSASFINSAPLRSEYSHLSIPVRIRDRLVALIELLYPDHRKTDPRVQEIFNLMATSLAIVAERELVNLELRKKGLHDPISGAGTRELFVERLTETLDSIVLESTNEPILFCLDVDDFQEINDDLGYEFGVHLLKKIRERAERISMDGDFIGRVVGAEFLMVLNQTKGAGDLQSVLRRVESVLNEPYVVGDTSINIHLSIGCVVVSDPLITPEEIIRRAEEAMRMVKMGTKSGICISDEEILQEHKKRKSIDRKVREAVGSNRLNIYYQPIVEIKTSKIVGAETLLRLVEKNGSILSAEEFIGGLERTRLLSRVDEWSLSEALHCLADHHAIFSTIPGFHFSLNFSPEALAEDDFCERFFNKIQNADIAHSSLHLEITEKALLPNNRNVLNNIHRLRESETCISIDDFGTGYSNLAMLNNFPIDTIKIDRSLLPATSDDNAAQESPLLEAIAGIAKSFGYKMIAEGIEFPEQLELVRGIGCQYAQGYLFGHPMPLNSFLELLQRSANQGL